MSNAMLETIRAKQRSATKGYQDLYTKAASSYGPFFGLYRGKVINNFDPMELNRLLVNVPTLPCSITSFAYPASPFGGPQVGMVCTPPMGANVWVKFENGDPSYPVWVGCFWTEGMKPALAELPTQQVFSTGSFNAMINDIPGEAEYLLEYGPPGFAVPSTVSVNTEAVTFTMGEVIFTATPEEVSALMAPTTVLFTNEMVSVTAGGSVTVVSPEVTTQGNKSIQGEVIVVGNVEQVGAVEVTGNLEVVGAIELQGNANVAGAMEIEGNVNVAGAMEIQGNTEIAGAVEVEGNVVLTGATEMAGDIALAGAVEIAGDIALAGAVEVGGALVSISYTPGGLNII
jgi:cytoskeletal protein CcmA (bactofilin family)